MEHTVLFNFVDTFCRLQLPSSIAKSGTEFNLLAFLTSVIYLKFNSAPYFVTDDESCNRRNMSSKWKRNLVCSKIVLITRNFRYITLRDFHYFNFQLRKSYDAKDTTAIVD